MKTTGLFISFLFLFSITISAQSTNADKLIREAKDLTVTGYFSFDKKPFIKAVALCERVLSTNKENTHAHYYIAYSAYRIMNILMVTKQTDAIDKYFALGEKHASALIGKASFASEADVILASINMMKLAVKPEDGMTLSAVVAGYISKAVENDADNPRAFVTRGIMSFNTPEAFGGSKTNAAADFEKAISIFKNSDEPKPGSLMPDWGNLEAKAWLGRSYQALGKTGKAEKIYTEALTDNPNFGWVKYSLLPQLQKKIQSKKEN